MLPSGHEANYCLHLCPADHQLFLSTANKEANAAPVAALALLCNPVQFSPNRTSARHMHFRFYTWENYYRLHNNNDGQRN